MIIRVKKKHFYFIYLPILLVLISIPIVVYAAETTETFSIAITTGTNDPVVYNVTTASITPISGSHFALVDILFNVTDADGVDDSNSGLNDSSAMVNITFSPGTANEYSRYNSTSCGIVGSNFNSGLDRTYNCTVAIRFYDNASTFWVINASVFDDSTSSGVGVMSQNTTQNITINSLSAIDLVDSDLALSAAIGSSNNELTLVLNNTGNFDFTYFNLTPFVLNATVTDFFMLGGESAERGSANFSFNTTPSASTSTGAGVGLENNTWINISDSYAFGGTEGVSISLPAAPPQDAVDINNANKSMYIYVDIPTAVGLTSSVTYNSSQSPDHRWIILAE